MQNFIKCQKHLNLTTLAKTERTTENIFLWGDCFTPTNSNPIKNDQVSQSQTYIEAAKKNTSYFVAV